MRREVGGAFSVSCEKCHPAPGFMAAAAVLLATGVGQGIRLLVLWHSLWCWLWLARISFRTGQCGGGDRGGGRGRSHIVGAPGTPAAQARLPVWWHLISRDIETSTPMSKASPPSSAFP